MNPALALLQPYPFEKLGKLFSDVEPPADRQQILWSVGEPKHPVPPAIVQKLQESAVLLGTYPPIAASVELRTSIGNWIDQRFLQPQAIDPERHVLPVNGTREALYSIAQCVVSPCPGATVVMPNPFYQIYEGATLLAGATPWFQNLSAQNSFKPDFDAVPDAVWKDCQLIYICNPGNPAGSVLSTPELIKLIDLADKFDFVIASDECYSELYFDENNPPAGLLKAAWQSDRTDFKRCIVFHSLSKRSSSPGLRSGFVAGDADIIKQYRQFRTYHGCSMPPPIQAASITAWSDELHVRENRRLYKEKFADVLKILSPVIDGNGDSFYTEQPEGGFYLWTRVPGDDTKFARQLYAKENLVVLPGSYLSRTAHGITPGYGYVRMALVAPQEQCLEGAERLKRFVEHYKEE